MKIRPALLYSLLVTLTTLAATYAYWRNEELGSKHKQTTALNFLADGVARNLKERLAGYELVLRGVKGFYESSDQITVHEYQTYIEALQLQRTRPGLLAVGVARVIPKTDGALHAVIGLIEPLNSVNVKALGFDVASNPLAKPALEIARDTGAAALTHKLTLVQDKGLINRTSVVMYVPIYAPGAPVLDIAQRRKAIVALANGPFRVSDLVLSLGAELNKTVALEIFDGDTIDPQHRLYADSAVADALPLCSMGHALRLLDVGGQRWTLVLHPLPEFYAETFDTLHQVVAVGGTLLSLLLGWLVWMLGTGRERALGLATRMNQALTATQLEMEATLDAMPDVLFEVGLDGRYYKYRTSRLNLLAAPPDTLLGKLIADVMPATQAATCLAALQEANSTGFSSGKQIELELVSGVRWFELSVARKGITVGADARFVMLSRDITMRKLAEVALQASVQEKTALLNEVHHRVKNNLQVVSSLLRLEGGRSEHVDTKNVLGDMQGRIRSMALLHESLYRSGTFASVELAAYLKQLCQQAFRTSAQLVGEVRLVLDMTPVQVSLDLATPCGLLANELISNCLKHGFPHGRTGEVRVTLRPVDGSQLRLTISDNGVGLPTDFETRRTTSLGLQLVSDLTRQLDGTLHVGTGPGAEFSIVFPC